MSSSDPNFRPTALATGPDGGLYIADWSNAIIGHMQHHIRDPNRDQTHGRIYRMTYEGRPLSKAPKIDGQPVAALLELLKEPDDQTRILAKIELDKHDSKEVIAATKAWVASLKSGDPEIEVVAQANRIRVYVDCAPLPLIDVTSTRFNSQTYFGLCLNRTIAGGGGVQPYFLDFYGQVL